MTKSGIKYFEFDGKYSNLMIDSMSFFTHYQLIKKPNPPIY